MGSVHRADPNARHPRRDQGWLLADWLRALRPLRMPGDQVQLQGRQGNWRQEDGLPPLAQVERDGRGCLRPAAAALLTRSRIARVFRALLSWMATLQSCLAR